MPAQRVKRNLGNLDVYELETSLENAIIYLEELLEYRQNEGYRDLQIELTDNGYDADLTMSLFGYRDETEKEMLAREKKEAKGIQQKTLQEAKEKNKRQKQYEKLRKEFGS